MQVEVKKKPLVYAGRKYQVGETLEMDAKHARLFVTLRQVEERNASAAEDDPPPKRTYRRRDMKAE